MRGGCVWKYRASQGCITYTPRKRLLGVRSRQRWVFLSSHGNNFPVFQPLNCHQNTLKCNDSIHLLASVLSCARSPFGGAAGTFSLLGNFRRKSQQTADRACKKGSWLCLLSSSAVAAFTSLKNMMYLILFSGLL